MNYSLEFNYPPQICVKMNHDSSEDIVKALRGFKHDDGIVFEPLGNYAVVFFNAAEFIGKFIEGFVDKTICYANRNERCVPVECGPVLYGIKSDNHPKLFKLDDRFRYQREFRIRLGLSVSKSKYDAPLNLGDYRIIHEELNSIKVFSKEELLADFEQNGFITFRCEINMER